MSNPYEPPKQQTAASVFHQRKHDPGVVFIGIILIAVVFASVGGLFLPQLREIVMPRFGWVGGFIGINALIPLFAWIKTPTRMPLVGSSFMLCAIGLINACTLLTSGTVDVVENVFHDRLHSSWFWAVASFFVASVYTLIVAYRTNPIQK